MNRKIPSVRNVIPASSPYHKRKATIEKKQNTSVVDLFKDGNKPAKVRGTNQEYLNSRHIWANNMNTTSHVRNTANDFSKIVRDESIKEIKLVGDYSVIDLPIEASIRVESFYAPGGDKIAFKSITKVEEIQPSEYSSDTTFHLKANGFEKFYQLYKKSEFNPNVEVKLCQMAVR